MPRGHHEEEKRMCREEILEVGNHANIRVKKTLIFLLFSDC
jgi:hypothetical protein